MGASILWMLTVVLLCLLSHSPTLLKVIVDRPWRPVVDRFAQSHTVDSHSQGHRCKHNTYHSFLLCQALQYDILIVLRSLGVVHSEEPVVAEVWGPRRIVAPLIQAFVEVGIKIGTHI